MQPKLIRTRRFVDARGWFTESYNFRRLIEAGIEDVFVQDNHSCSANRGTVRGLHFQHPPHAQAKLVRCIAGSIWDVIVDVRNGSPTWGRWAAATLTADGGEQLYVPSGFAHGFISLRDECEVVYKASSYYAPASEGAIAWNDRDLAIAWPLQGAAPSLSPKDAAAPSFSELSSSFTYDGEPFVAISEIEL